MEKYNVAIVGATGLVGCVLLEVLQQYNFPVNKLRLFASEKSIGKEIAFNECSYFVEELNEKSFLDCDFAFFVAGSKVSERWVPSALESNAIVIDNSSFFRMNQEVGLIVPEINIGDFNINKKLISNPNCSTIQSVLVLNALKDYGLKRVIFNTYQAVSGSGMKGIKDLENTLIGKDATFYPYNISKTCLPQIDSFLDNGYTKEEMKMVNETKKILNLPDLEVTATCVRVPILYSHAVSVLVELEKDFIIEEIVDKFQSHKEIVVLDDIQNNIYPVSTVSNKTDKVYVGRIRKDLSSNNSLMFYCVADNLYRGAASNAVLIALKIIENYQLKSIAT